MVGLESSGVVPVDMAKISSSHQFDEDGLVW